MTFKELQEEIRSRRTEHIYRKIYKKITEDGFFDIEYMKHTDGKKISEVENDIKKMTLQECGTWLTWILRGERFCEGLFQTCIDNGVLLRLIERCSILE